MSKPYNLLVFIIFIVLICLVVRERYLRKQYYSLYRLESATLLNSEKKLIDSGKNNSAHKDKSELASAKEYIIPLSAFKKATQGATLRLEEDVLYITSLPKQWYYTATASLKGLLDIQGSGVITIKTKTTNGSIGYGIVGEDNSTYLVKEQIVDTCDEWRYVQLRLSSLENVRNLIVRSCAIDGTTSAAIIQKVSFALDKDDRLTEEPLMTNGKLTDTPKDVAFRLLNYLIIKDFPELRSTNIKDQEKVNILRQWVHQNVDYAISEGIVKDAVLEDYANRTASELFLDFLEDRLAVFCYGTASSLVKLYQVYGYRSYLMSIGWNKDTEHMSTHAVTLVEVVCDSKTIWSIQDADYNYTYVDSNGVLLDYFEIIRRLKRKQHSSVIVQEGVVRPREMVATGPVTADGSWVFSSDTEKPKLLRVLPNGRYIYAGNGSLNEFSNNFLPYLFEAYLKKDGFPCDVRYIHLYPYDIKNEIKGEGSQLLERVKAVIRER